MLGIPVVAAARLGGSIAAKECPVLGTPVIEPESILLDYRLAERFVWRRIPGSIGSNGKHGRIEAERASEGGGDKCVAARSQLEAVVGEGGEIGRGRMESTEKIDQTEIVF